MDHGRSAVGGCEGLAAAPWWGAAGTGRAAIRSSGAPWGYCASADAEGGRKPAEIEPRQAAVRDGPPARCAAQARSLGYGTSLGGNARGGKPCYGGVPMQRPGMSHRGGPVGSASNAKPGRPSCGHRRAPGAKASFRRAPPASGAASLGASLRPMRSIRAPGSMLRRARTAQNVTPGARRWREGPLGEGRCRLPCVDGWGKSKRAKVILPHPRTGFWLSLTATLGLLAVGCHAPAGNQSPEDLFLMAEYDRNEGRRRVACIFLGSSFVLLESSDVVVVDDSDESGEKDFVDDTEKVHWVTSLKPNDCEALSRALGSVEWQSVESSLLKEIQMRADAEAHSCGVRFRLRDSAGKFRSYTIWRKCNRALDEVVREINRLLPRDYRIEWCTSK